MGRVKERLRGEMHLLAEVPLGVTVTQKQLHDRVMLLCFDILSYNISWMFCAQLSCDLCISFCLFLLLPLLLLLFSCHDGYYML